MPSRRFLLVEGVDGHPVVDPHNPAANPARYVGWRLRGEPAKDPDFVLEHYEIERQVIADHGDLRAAAKAGHLRIVGDVIAKSHEEATTRLAGYLAPTPTTVER